jgi:hypothetical protein
VQAGRGDADDAIARPDGSIAFAVTGVCPGEILPTPRGEGGFGYDPIFYVPAYGLTFAVTADDAAVWTRFEVDYGIPSLTLLGPGAVVVAADDMGAVSKIPEALPD